MYKSIIVQLYFSLHHSRQSFAGRLKFSCENCGEQARANGSGKRLGLVDERRKTGGAVELADGRREAKGAATRTLSTGQDFAVGSFRGRRFTQDVSRRSAPKRCESVR